MNFIGDVHGKFNKLNSILDHVDGSVIQLGDLGIGFQADRGFTNFVTDKQFYFIRGNHDNPHICNDHPNFIGNYGICEGVFCISGAHSIDKELRIPEMDWWEGEELSYTEMCEMLDVYTHIKPEIVATHDCPYMLYEFLTDNIKTKSRTNQFFDILFENHIPKKWVFGHHHRSFRKNINGCEFIGLNELEIMSDI